MNIDEYPAVDKRQAFSDTKNLGASLTLPYFWALSDDKNLTISCK